MYPEALRAGSGAGRMLCTASVFERRLEPVRARFSMFRKSVLPPVLSW